VQNYKWIFAPKGFPVEAHGIAIAKNILNRIIPESIASPIPARAPHQTAFGVICNNHLANTISLFHFPHTFVSWKH